MAKRVLRGLIRGFSTHSLPERLVWGVEIEGKTGFQSKNKLKKSKNQKKINHLVSFGGSRELRQLENALEHMM
eukprot:1384731-Amorphochlora_amoeboformis.AAC.2